MSDHRHPKLIADELARFALAGIPFEDAVKLALPAITPEEESLFQRWQKESPNTLNQALRDLEMAGIALSTPILRLCVRVVDAGQDVIRYARALGQMKGGLPIPSEAPEPDGERLPRVR